MRPVRTLPPLLVMSASMAFGSQPSPGQSELLSKGETVVVEEKNGESCWPTVVVYKNIAAPPEKVFRAFTDYESAPRFAKNLRSARVEDSASDGSWKVVFYTVNVPVLPDITYRVKNTAFELPSGGYRVEWEKVESDFFREISGSLDIERNGEGSLVCYRSSLSPSSQVVSPLRGFVRKEAERVMENFALLVESGK